MIYIPFQQDFCMDSHMNTFMDTHTANSAVTPVMGFSVLLFSELL